MGNAATALLIAILLCLQSTHCVSQDTLQRNTVLFPASMEVGDVCMAIEVAMIKMPEAVVEEADTYRWPSLTLDTWLGLPAHFMIDCRLTSQVINWKIQVSTKWQWSGFSPLGIAIGADIGYFIGGLGSGAFDNSNYSAFFYPNASVGWRNENLAVTLKGELSYCLAKVDRAGDIEVSRTKNFFNGGTVGAFLEQPFWGTTNFMLGFRLGYIKYAYQNWLLFPTIQRYYILPEVMMGIRL